MASTITYIPSCHCFCCINLGRQVSCTKQVAKAGKTFRVCDAHFDVVDQAVSIEEALRKIRRDKKKGDAA